MYIQRSSSMKIQTFFVTGGSYNFLSKGKKRNLIWEKPISFRVCMHSCPHGGVVIKSLLLSAGWLAGLTEQMVGLAAANRVRDPEQHHRSSMQMKSPHSVHSSIFSIFRSYNARQIKQKCGHLGRAFFSHQ